MKRLMLFAGAILAAVGLTFGLWPVIGGFALVGAVAQA